MPRFPRAIVTIAAFGTDDVAERHTVDVAGRRGDDRGELLGFGAGKQQRERERS